MNNVYDDPKYGGHREEAQSGAGPAAAGVQGHARVSLGYTHLYRSGRHAAGRADVFVPTGARGAGAPSPAWYSSDPGEQQDTRRDGGLARAPRP